jgi:hypothetical protein
VYRRVPRGSFVARAAVIGLSLSAAATVTVTSALPASAEAHPTHLGLVADQPVNYTPNVLDGHVNAFAQVGNTMIVGGTFSKVEQNGVVYQRQSLFAFNATTGAVSTAFSPLVAGQVYDLQLTPDQTHVIVVGNFHDVDAAANTGRIAELSIADGSVVSGFVSPEPNDTVRDIASGNAVYYVSGDFTKMGTHSRRGVAAISSSGADTGDVALDIGGTNGGGQTKVQAMDLSPDASKLVLAGNFDSIDGQHRGQLAVIDLAPGSATLSSWNTPRMSPVCGPRFDTYTRDVAIDPSGTYFVLVNTGGPRGTQASGLLCDSASRWELGSTASDIQPTWIDYSGGDTLTAAIADTNAVYVGGHMRWLNNSLGRNSSGPGAVRREGIAALDPANGLPLTWNPGKRRGYGVYGFALTQEGLWTGSDTTGFGGELRDRLAFCRIGTGDKLPPYLTGTLPGHIVQLGVGATTDVATMSFNGIAVGTPKPLASLQYWPNVRGTFAVDDVLYSGWSHGKLRAQPFDGTTLGSPHEVDLHDTFRDLADVRSMFFDRETHRLYYTSTLGKGLYYRYFAPQSELVGSHRYHVDAPSEVTWKHVQTAFVVNQMLFYVDSTTGNLMHVGWDNLPGTTNGTPVDVLGPSIDGTDFRAAGLVFVS